MRREVASRHISCSYTLGASPMRTKTRLTTRSCQFQLRNVALKWKVTVRYQGCLNQLASHLWATSDEIGDRVLEFSAIIEARSEHPLGRPIVQEALRRGVDISQAVVSEFHNHPGLGVHARVNGVWVGVGGLWRLV
jgi:hypothetical protein